MIDALLPLGLLIVVCKLVEGMFERFGLNSIVAYTITGTLLGPVLNIIEPTRELQTFLGIGIFVFFFLVGLDEIDIPSFVATIRGRFFVAATVSVLISLIVALVLTSNLFDISFALNLNFMEALALAGILSLSSLGLVAKVLADKGHFKEPIGLEIFTTVIIAELLALLVVGFSISEIGEQRIRSECCQCAPSADPDSGFRSGGVVPIGEDSAPCDCLLAAHFECTRTVVWTAHRWTIPDGGGRRKNPPARLHWRTAFRRSSVWTAPSGA